MREFGLIFIFCGFPNFQDSFNAFEDVLILNTGKQGLEKTPYLDTSCSVHSWKNSTEHSKQIKKIWRK